VSDETTASRANPRILLVDDHTLVRQSLAKTLEAEGLEIAGEASRGDECLPMIASLHPDVVILDIGTPGMDGLEVARHLKKQPAHPKILFMTMRDDDATIWQAVQLGADGYVLKTASTEELVQAVRAVAEGGSYLSAPVARRVMQMASGDRVSSTAGLTQREFEILELLAHGNRPTEIASKLFVSVKTVKNHLTSIYAKMGVETGTQAVAEAFRRGLVRERLN
jgi:DNA-binding NarL/FixJ family response regulator